MRSSTLGDETIGRRGAVIGYDRQILLAAGFVVATAACAAVLWHGPAPSWRVARFGAAALLPLLIAVQGSSLMMRRLPKRLWRHVHMSSYVLFWLAAVHGALAGTDAGHPGLSFPR